MTINEMLTEALDRLCVDSPKAEAIRALDPNTFEAIAITGAGIGVEYSFGQRRNEQENR